MSLQIKQINPNIGAIVEGVDLNQVNSEIAADIHRALLKHQVIFFRQQMLTAQSQVKLAKIFGTLHIHPIYPALDEAPEVIILDSHRQDLRDNDLWHTDVTFSQTPPLGCVLQAIKIPASGGDTLWASGTAAFQALPEDLKQQLRGLTATHDMRKSFPTERFATSLEDQQRLERSFRQYPPVIHPVIRTHPETGEEILFVNEGFTTDINQLSDSENEDLLAWLFAHIVKPEFHLRWQWQAGDVAIWDNRSTQHKALFDYGDAHRIMHRATINGTVPYYTAP
ncbi:MULTISPECIES: taurine dioxygenase [unclassified Acinetobacter]|uniref:taurine dioxygenase n=1 Tax=unclassified Acinetobacter TaxID=196816 RepID=UPI002934F823|nr:MULTISPECIES: taurine dioxygenase [unclassified Acinetobacter]WOE31292.1 taurine dioxygenase [Acinetobacter sp. SAAs470]WOE39488.1 taurine dioxygenase [Acinetobacter sp. SAAs474]